jgi:hypothetical protein
MRERSQNLFGEHKKGSILTLQHRTSHTSNNSRKMLTALFQKGLYCAGRVNYIVLP